MTSRPLFSNLLEPDINKKFTALCEEAESKLVRKLMKDVDAHVARGHQILRVNEFLDISTLEKIANTLKVLLEDIQKYPAEKQKLIIGAAHYFIKDDDVYADFESLLGFDDDIAVLNYVLMKIDREDLRIQF